MNKTEPDASVLRLEEVAARRQELEVKRESVGLTEAEHSELRMLKQLQAIEHLKRIASIDGLTD